MLLVVTNIAISYLIVNMLTFLFNKPPHLFLHVHQLLDHIILLSELLNVSSEIMYLFSDPPVDAHHILPLTLPLELLGDHHDALLCRALEFLELAADLVEAAVVDARLEPRHLRDDLAHVVGRLDCRLLEGLLDPLHIRLVLLQLVHLGLQVADHLRGGQVVTVSHCALQPVQGVVQFLDILGLLLINLDCI